MTEESIVSRMTKLEAHVAKCRSRGILCEKWANSHEAKLTWAMDRVNEARNKRDELRAKVEELNNLVTELTARLDQGENQVASIDRICTFRASNFHSQLQWIQEHKESRSTSTSCPVSPTHPAPPGPDVHEFV